MPRTRNPKRKYKRRRLYKKGSKRTRKSFKKAVQRVIDKNAETKHAYNTLTTTSFNSGISGSGDIIRVLPNINNGTADNARIGDQIRLKTLQMKGALVWAPTVANFGTYNSARIYARLMIVSPKYYQTTDAVINNTGWLNILLKKGGTTSAFNGDINDLWAPINTDAITKYYDRVFLLDGVYGNTSTNMVITGSTRMFSKTIRFKGAGKLLRYDSSVSSGLQPTNFAPVFLLGYAYANGAAPSTVNTDLQCQWDCNFMFQDV